MQLLPGFEESLCLCAWIMYLSQGVVAIFFTEKGIVSINLWSSVRCSNAAQEGTVEITYTLWLFEAGKQPECKLEGLCSNTLQRSVYCGIMFWVHLSSLLIPFFMLYNSTRYHVCSSFASLCKIFSFLPNYREEGILIAVLGVKHTRVRNKFSKHMHARNNPFIMLTCCIACNTWYAPPEKPKSSVTIV